MVKNTPISHKYFHINLFLRFICQKHSLSSVCLGYKLRMKIILSFVFCFIFTPLVYAQTTVTVGSTGTSTAVRDLGDEDTGNIPTDPATEALLEQIEQTPTVEFVRDENGFLVDAATLAQRSAENAAPEEEEPEIRQIYRGDEGRNKREPARTHLMYEPTQY